MTMVPGDFLSYDNKDLRAHRAASVDLPKLGYELIHSARKEYDPTRCSATWIRKARTSSPKGWGSHNGLEKIETFLSVDLDQPLGEVLQLCRKHPYLQYVVLKRRKKDKVSWYVYDYQFFFNLLSPLQVDFTAKNPLSKLISFERKDPSSNALKPGTTPPIPRILKAWPGAGFPVGVDGNKPICLWAPGMETMGVSIGDLDEDDLEDIDDEEDEEDEADEEDEPVLPLPSSSLASASSSSISRPPYDLKLLPTSSGEPVTRHPQINLSEEHPVAESVIDVTVLLSLQKVSHTAGEVVLPRVPGEKLELEVHLLFGETLSKSTLTVTAGGETRKEAQFRVSVPPMRPGADNVIPDQQQEWITANFYYEKRWCGQGARLIDVRADAAVLPKRVVTPERTPLCSAIHLEKDALPPDLLIRIQCDPKAPKSFRWSCLSPHLPSPPFSETDDRMTLDHGAQEFVKTHFEPLAGVTLDDVAVQKIEGLGNLLYKQAPRSFKVFYGKLRDGARSGKFPLETIQIVTDEPYVPWELLRPSDEEPEFLSVRHQVGRWLSNSSARLSQKIQVDKLAVFATSYKGIEDVTELPWAEEERKYLVKRFKAQSCKVKSKPVLSFLEDGTAQVLHFACHGKMFPDSPDESQLLLEDNLTSFTPPVLVHEKVRNGIGRHKPFVFLNACQLGGVGKALTLVAGWPSAFLEIGASAFVGPLWTIKDDTAKGVCRSFYESGFVPGGAGSPLGEILKKIRSGWKESRNLTLLSYVLYGDPRARIVYRG